MKNAITPVLTSLSLVEAPEQGGLRCRSLGEALFRTFSSRRGN